MEGVNYLLRTLRSYEKGWGWWKRQRGILHHLFSACAGELGLSPTRGTIVDVLVIGRVVSEIGFLGF